MANSSGSFRFKFVGRQVNAIGAFSQIYDTYKAPNLGKALFMLHSDYEIIKELKVFDTTNMSSIFDSFEQTLVDPEVVKKTKLIRFKYPKREISAKTGSYKYYRADAPDNYNF